MAPANGDDDDESLRVVPRMPAKGRRVLVLP
jgi:hypothetical protein